MSRSFVTQKIFTQFINLALGGSLLAAILVAGEPRGFAASTSLSGPKLLATFTLPRTSLEVFAPTNHRYDLAKAQKHGLKFTNLPSIGSGLARRSDGALFGITDRGSPKDGDILPQVDMVRLPTPA